MTVQDPIDISVIIPVYQPTNASLKRAIESSIALPGSYEIVIIFDGKPTLEVQTLVDSYSQQGVQSITLTHGGVAQARNAGIKAAKGKWITFLDADDALCANNMAKLIEFGNQHNCELVQGSYTKIMSRGTEHCNIKNESYIWENNTIKDFLISVLQVDRGTGTVWSKIFLRYFLIRENILFNTSLVLDEDTLFVIDAAAVANKIGFIPANVYDYHRNSGSTVTTFHNNYAQQVHHSLSVIQERVISLQDHEIEIAFEEHTVFYLLLVMLHYVFNNSNSWSELTRKRHFRALLNNPMYARALSKISLSHFSRAKQITILLLRIRSYSGMKLVCKVRNRQLG